MTRSARNWGPAPAPAFATGNASAALLATAVLAGAIITSAGTAAGQTRTVAPADGSHLREIRCNQDAQAHVVQRQLLKLTEEQCLMIGREVSILPENVPQGTWRSAFDALDRGLLIGRTVPAGLVLAPLADRVTAAHPALGRYRYFISAHDIVIVDPAQNAVVSVIDVLFRPRQE